MSDFGVITLATGHDYVKAVGMMLSLKQQTPDVKVTLVTSPAIAEKVGSYFDQVILENENLRGFEHKVYLDQYTPYSSTFFFDADILIFGDLEKLYQKCHGTPYYVHGRYLVDGYSSFGLDRQFVLKKIGKDRLVNIGGAGHAYFEKPACQELFELSRQIARNYTDYANSCRFADEDVVGIAMTMLDIPPAVDEAFQARLRHAAKGTMEMDVTKRLCRFKAVADANVVEPFMVHFAAREGGLLYYRNLRKLFDNNGVALHQELVLTFLNDFQTLSNWRLRSVLKKMLGR